MHLKPKIRLKPSSRGGWITDNASLVVGNEIRSARPSVEEHPGGDSNSYEAYLEGIVKIDEV